MKVLTEWETLQRVEEGCSLSRFGDGETKFINRGQHRLQKQHPQLRELMIHSLGEKDPSFLPAINPIFESKEKLETYHGQWEKFYWNRGVEFQQYLIDRDYGSFLVSRLEFIPSCCCDDYFERWRGVWASRPAVGVFGQHVDPKDFKGFFPFKKAVKVPSLSAWDSHGRVMKEVRKDIPKEGVVVLSCGGTASGLAYLLWQEGYQAVDVGRMGRGWLVWQEGRKATKEDYKNATKGYRLIW